MGAKKRRLVDLYQVGKSVVFDDGEGEIEVWLHKPNDIEQEAMFRRAQAERIKFLRHGRDETSDEFLEAYETIQGFDDEDLIIDISLLEEINKIRSRVEAQITTDEDGEWGKDDYYQSLVDKWIGDADNRGLKDDYAVDPEDPEALECLKELDRYNEEVRLAVEVEVDALRTDAKKRPFEQVMADAARQQMKQSSDARFMKEYKRQFLFFAARDPERKQDKYFTSIEEMDICSDPVRQRLYVEINDFMLEVTEGKGSPATPDGSPPSEQPATEEASQDFGHEEAPA